MIGLMRAQLFAVIVAVAAVPATAETANSSSPIPEADVLQNNSLRLAWANLEAAIIRGLNENKTVTSVDADGMAVQLGSDTYLVTDGKSLGTFIVKRNFDKYAVIWDGGDAIDEVQMCSAYGGGMPPKKIGKLPDTNVGDHRFYVIDTGCLISGIVHRQYVSIMQLHGTNVIKKFGGQLENFAGEGTVNLRGNVLHIDDWHYFPDAKTLPCGINFDWQIQLSPTVKDLGRIPPKDLRRQRMLRTDSCP